MYDCFLYNYEILYHIFGRAGYPRKDMTLLVFSSYEFFTVQQKSWEKVPLASRLTLKSFTFSYPQSELEGILLKKTSAGF